jgi:hypothetical protein
MFLLDMWLKHHWLEVDVAIETSETVSSHE